MDQQKIYLITGASQGLGLSLVKYLLQKNQTVIVTTRDAGKFDPSLRKNANLEVYGLDLTSEEAVKNMIGDIIEKHGRIDVLINNAGYGFVGSIEETSSEEEQQVIAVNVHAPLRMIRLVLPHMRKMQNGHIINLSSIAGIIGSGGWGMYNASKFAVEGFSEALYQEVIEFGIKVTVVAPSAIRTNFLGGSLTSSKLEMKEYANSSGKRRKTLAANNGKQPIDPEKAAAAIYDVIQMTNPPFRLLLGKEAYERASKKLEQLKADYEGMKAVTLSTEF